MFKNVKNANGYARGYGGCLRCGDRWNWKSHHVIPYGGGAGMFPLCEECYNKLSPEERYRYCRELAREWEKWGRSEEDIDLDVVREHIGLVSSEETI